MNKLYAPDEAGGGVSGGGQEGPVTSVLEGTPVATGQPAVQNGQPAPTRTGAAIQEPFWKGWINEDGTINKGRYDHLPDELKPMKPTLDRLGTLPDLLKSYQHQTTLVGKKGLLPLRPEASESERKEFDARLREVLSVPKTPEEYGIKRPEDIPAELWNDEYAGKMSQLLHKHAISPEAVKDLVAYNHDATKAAILEMESQQEKQRQEHVKSVNAAVAKEWGMQQNEKLALAQRGAKFLGIDPASPIFTENPEVAFACARAAEHIREARAVTGDSPDNGIGATAQEQLNAMISDPTNKYYAAMRDPGHPGFQEAARMQRVLAEQVVKERRRGQ